MTDEEKAEEIMYEVLGKNGFWGEDVDQQYAMRMCIKGLAEGRKEQENKDKGFCESFCMKGGRIAELEKENAELKKENIKLRERLNSVNKSNDEYEMMYRKSIDEHNENIQLKAQIENMKNFYNCSHSSRALCPNEHKCNGCKDWGLAE